MKNSNEKGKSLVILDFDGTLYYNPAHSFSINVDLRNIIEAERFYSHLFFNAEIDFSSNLEIILITGRSIEQRPYILEALKLRGYEFKEAYFRTLDLNVFQMDENTYMTHYREGKVNLITQIYQSGEYNNIYIFDDDIELVKILYELGFKVFHVTLHSPLCNNPIEIYPCSSMNKVPYSFKFQLQEEG